MQDGKPNPNATGEVDYESTPLLRGEYISALVHLYRGELYRANSWRIRLDNTTNWSVLTTAGLLTLSFNEGAQSHWVLLIGLLLITSFLCFEARRFRVYDVWRTRVRMIEENFYGPILRRDPTSPESLWGDFIADDLLRPRFKMGRIAALRARFVRNYWPIFLVILSAWVLKVTSHPTPAKSWDEIVAHLRVGILPWWLPLVYVGTFLSVMLLLMIFGPRSVATKEDHWTNFEG